MNSLFVILLVEDNPADVRLTREALLNGKVQHELHVAKDGVEAMAFLRNQGAFQKAPRPDMILLDLEVPELPEAALLDRLPRRPATARIPVLAITGRYEAALRLREAGRVAAVLRKPVSGVNLREAVDRLMGPHGSLNSGAQRWERQRQGELILHLLVKGSDPLVFQIAQRICADRTYAPPADRAMALTWADIADWGRREGLLEVEQAHLLRRVPLARALRAQAPAA